MEKNNGGPIAPYRMEMERSAKAAEEGRGVEVEETLWRGRDWERT